MKTRYVVAGVLLVLTVAAFLAAMPSSPFYLPEYLNSGDVYEGRSVSSWSKDLSNADPEVRQAGALALGSIGKGAEKSVPSIAKLMIEDPDANVRVAASFAIMKIGESAKEAVPSLIKALDDEEGVVRFNAANAIRIIGPEAKSATPALIKGLAEERNQVYSDKLILTIQDGIALAIGKVTKGTDDGVPALMEALKTTKLSPTRKAIVRALGEIGPAAKAALPLIIEFKADKDRLLRETVEIAVKEIERKDP